MPQKHLDLWLGKTVAFLCLDRLDPQSAPLLTTHLNAWAITHNTAIPPRVWRKSHPILIWRNSNDELTIGGIRKESEASTTCITKTTPRISPWTLQRKTRDFKPSPRLGPIILTPASIPAQMQLPFTQHTIWTISVTRNTWNCTRLTHNSHTQKKNSSFSHPRSKRSNCLERTLVSPKSPVW